MENTISGFKPISGKHCVSTAIKHIFDYYGLNISENMIFGLSSGLNFGYFEYGGVPVIAGRTKVGTFEKTLSENLGVNVEIITSTSESKSQKMLNEFILKDIPVIVYVDMFYLPYLNRPNHFGGHALVVFGYDKSKDQYYISDRDSYKEKMTLDPEGMNADYHILTSEELTNARGSNHKPFPAKNKIVNFNFDNGAFQSVTEEMLIKAIKTNILTLKHSPIKNIGLKGIETFANKLVKWERYNLEELKESAINCYIMINQIGGTGGGAFRNMYGDFLLEAAQILTNQDLESTGHLYKDIGREWDNVGEELLNIHQGATNKGGLGKISQRVLMIYNKEMTALSKLEESI